MTIPDFWSLFRVCVAAVFIVCTLHIVSFTLRYTIDEIANTARRARK